MRRTATRDVDVMQRWFQAAVMHPGGAELAAEDRATRRLLPARAKRLEDVLLPSVQMTARERLDVYAISYFLRLRDVMKVDFAVLAHALGDDGFDAVMKEYVTRHPPSSFTLNAYGAGVADFLARECTVPTVRAVARRRKFLVELATLERTVEEVFHAPRAKSLPAAALRKMQSIAPEKWFDATLVAIPALRLHAFTFPVNHYLQAVYDGKSPDVPQPLTNWLVVYRKDWKSWRARLSREQFLLLSHLVRGKTLGAAIAATVRSLRAAPGSRTVARRAEVEAAADAMLSELGGWFREWTAEGMFAEIRV